MRKKQTNLFLFFLLVLIVNPNVVLPQGLTTASLNGIVKDSKGEPLPSVIVIAVHQPTGNRH
jgi:hypothetical protein